jgi:hypothetical protein
VYLLLPAAMSSLPVSNNNAMRGSTIIYSYSIFVIIFVLLCIIPVIFKNGEDRFDSTSSTRSRNNGRLQHSSSSLEGVLSNLSNYHPRHEMVPTLLSVMTSSNNGFANALQNDVYEEMLSPHVQYILTNPSPTTATTDAAGSENRKGTISSFLRSSPSSSFATSKMLGVSKTEINFHESLSVSWENLAISDEDILALYCPASELNPRHFQDAATIYQAKVTSIPRSATNNNPIEEKTWFIESFPVIREESCEFRVYSRILESQPTVEVGNSWWWNNVSSQKQQEKQLTSSTAQRRTNSQPLQYRQLATSPTIHIKSTLKPTAIHIALSENAHEMHIHFVTSDKCSSGPPTNQQQDTACVIIPIVRYYQGSKAGYSNADATLLQVGTSTTYKATDMCSEPANITAPGKFRSPGLLHIVTLENLTQDTTYTYQPGIIIVSEHHGSTYEDILHHAVLDGDDATSRVVWSDDTFAFQSRPSPHDLDKPFSFLVYGDQGCPATGWTAGAKIVAQRMEREFSPLYDLTRPQVRAIHHFGDLAYAKGAAHIYDFWFHMIQPLASKVPYMIGIGNHEYLHFTGGANGKDPSGESSPGGYRPPWNNFGNDSGGECGVPIAKRFKMPSSSGSNGVFWYSFEFSSTHVIMLSSEHDLSSTSRQYQWLESDLRSLNRKRTPWVIIEIHRPLYNSFNLPDGQNAVGMAMREEIELLLMEYSVDLVLSGHYHSYLRTCNGLFQGICNNGGPTYITIGTAGAELSYASLYEQNWTEASFVEWGYGKVTVFNSSSLLFEFIVDDTKGTVKDYVWVTK